MSRLLSLFLLAGVAIKTATAVDILFKRYSQPGCDKETQHIAKDTHLDDNHCKTFDEDEPAYYSFIVKPEDDIEDAYNKFCTATVYDQKDCHGNSFSYGGMSLRLFTDSYSMLGLADIRTDMAGMFGMCQDSTIPGRSVYIACESASNNAAATTIMSVPTTMETMATMVTQQVQVISSVSTITSTSRPLPTTTVTLIPSQQYDDAWPLDNGMYYGDQTDENDHPNRDYYNVDDDTNWW